MFTKKGISQVMVTVLLTVIGIASVLLFWYVVLPMLQPSQIGLEASRVDITIKDSNILVELRLFNIGNVDLDVTSVYLLDESANYKSVTIESSNKHIPAGSSLSITCKGKGINIKQGKTYKVKVVVTTPDGSEQDFTFYGVAKKI